MRTEFKGIGSYQDSSRRLRKYGMSRFEPKNKILVVVAVIALLAALLLPAVKKAREKGRASVCLSNLRQIGLAFETYALD